MSENEQPLFIRDATDENFNELVLVNSSKGPVLVNFWSKKVGPCIRQYPVLEKLAHEFSGRFLLVNFNTDDFGALAREYGVTSLPTLKLFMKGEVVDTRHGYQDESDMKYLMAKYMPRESDARLTEAVRTFQQGDAEKALVMLAEATMEDPKNIRLPLTMAKLMVGEGRMEEAAQLLANMPLEQRDDQETRTLRGHIVLLQGHENAPPIEQLEDELASNSDNCEARYQLASHCFVEEDYARAMQLLSEVLQIDRQYQQGAAHQALMTLFAMLGDGHELVKEYRVKL
ncbi:MAG: tetratricopeptide repeat protein, partial [Gammaproteobacteria bacterium]|nr:tetratricopeptide repeat protein [Gammaproteobacteria bacterium]